MYDGIPAEAAAAPRIIKGRYPVEVQKRYVELFLESQPISQREFAKKYGINRKSIMRWLRVYTDIPPMASKNRYLPKAAPATGKVAAPGAAHTAEGKYKPARAVGKRPSSQASHGTDRKPGSATAPYDDGVRTITIPYMEYMELLALKTKLNAVRAVCQ